MNSHMYIKNIFINIIIILSKNVILTGNINNVESFYADKQTNF